MELLSSWLILSVAVFVTAQLLPGVRISGFGGALIVAALFGILNALIGWLFFVAIGVVTLGLGFLLAFVTRIVVNAIVLRIVDAFSTSLTIRGFGNAIAAAVLISGIGTLAEWLLDVSY
jgi:putative membrane protein